MESQNPFCTPPEPACARPTKRKRISEQWEPGSVGVVDGYFFEISTEARVVSHSMRSVQPAPLGSNAIVKFSTVAGSLEIFISTRARSLPGPGYAVPHSPVFLLMTSAHFPSPGIVKIV